MHKVIFTLTIAAVFMGACGLVPSPVPTVDVTAVYQTAEAGVATSVEQTLEAMPTATLRPTETPIPPTETPAYTDTPVFTETPSPTATLAVTNTSVPFQGSTPSGSDVGKTCLLRIENKSSIRPITIAFDGVSPNGNTPFYYAYQVELVMMFQLPWGSWNYWIKLGDKKEFRGSFRINNYDKTTIRIYNDRVQIQGP
jgi:hypothetical protein